MKDALAHHIPAVFSYKYFHKANIVKLSIKTSSTCIQNYHQTGYFPLWKKFKIGKYFFKLS